jgi:hypothetical protein
MTRRPVSGALLSVSVAVGVAGAAVSALAGPAGNGAAGTGFSQYVYEADAIRLCHGDTIVWGSSAHKGLYYVKGEGPERIGGLYACMADVMMAGYTLEQ